MFEATGYRWTLSLTDYDDLTGDEQPEPYGWLCVEALEMTGSFDVVVNVSMLDPVIGTLMQFKYTELLAAKADGHAR